MMKINFIITNKPARVRSFFILIQEVADASIKPFLHRKTGAGPTHPNSDLIDTAALARWPGKVEEFSRFNGFCHSPGEAVKTALCSTITFFRRAKAAVLMRLHSKMVGDFDASALCVGKVRASSRRLLLNKLCLKQP